MTLFTNNQEHSMMVIEGSQISSVEYDETRIIIHLTNNTSLDIFSDTGLSIATFTGDGDMPTSNTEPNTLV